MAWNTTLPNMRAPYDLQLLTDAELDEVGGGVTLVELTAGAIIAVAVGAIGYGLYKAVKQ